MAKVSEDVLIIKVSSLIRENDDDPVIFTSDVVDALEEAIGSMVPAGAIVEILKD